MILRLAAAVALGIGVTMLAAYFQLLGRAPWSAPADRHLRAMKDRTAEPARVEEMPLERFATLPRRAPLAQRVPLESRGVRVEAHVQRMIRAVDGDFHLDLVPRPPRPGVALPYVVAEITPGFRRVRPGWTYDRLVAALRPPRGGATAWDGGPARVRLTGWLLYDHTHEVRPPRPRYAQALAAWEIHPVTRLEVWNETRERFEEHR